LQAPFLSREKKLFLIVTITSTSPRLQLIYYIFQPVTLIKLLVFKEVCTNFCGLFLYIFTSIPAADIPVFYFIAVSFLLPFPEMAVSSLQRKIPEGIWRVLNSILPFLSHAFCDTMNPLSFTGVYTQCDFLVFGKIKRD
jgi:hypothetical protein